MPDFTINERLIQFAASKSLDASGLQKELGHGSPQKTYNVFNKDTGVSMEYLKDVLNKFKELSAEWVITGRGEMIKEKSIILRNEMLSFSEPENNYRSQKNLIEEIDNLKEEIRDLKSKHAELRSIFLESISRSKQTA